MCAGAEYTLEPNIHCAWKSESGVSWFLVSTGTAAGWCVTLDLVL
jgi:hypothetical protein